MLVDITHLNKINKFITQLLKETARAGSFYLAVTHRLGENKVSREHKTGGHACNYRHFIEGTRVRSFIQI